MNDMILDFQSVTKCYGTKRTGVKTAVDNATFSLERGRIYGFVGENGAGKTTCIRMMCGLSEPDEGQIGLFGTECNCNGLNGSHGKKYDAKTIATLRRKIGSLVEQPVLNPFVTARENLIERCILFGVDSLDSRITKILAETKEETVGAILSAAGVGVGIICNIANFFTPKTRYSFRGCYSICLYDTKERRLVAKEPVRVEWTEEWEGSIESDETDQMLINEYCAMKVEKELIRGFEKLRK